MFVTDGLEMFARAAKAFWRRGVFRMAHFEDIHLHNQLNSNDMHEKLNDEFRPRTKAARVRPHTGLGGGPPARGRLPIMLCIMIIYHNFDLTWA